MRVNDPNSTGIPRESVGGAGLERSEQSQATSRRSAGNGNRVVGDAPDSVSLSELSGKLQALNIDSPQRAVRMGKLSADVRAGRYQTDALQLSRHLIDEAMKLRT